MRRKNKPTKIDIFRQTMLIRCIEAGKTTNQIKEELHGLMYDINKPDKIQIPRTYRKCIICKKRFYILTNYYRTKCYKCSLINQGINKTLKIVEY